MLDREEAHHQLVSLGLQVRFVTRLDRLVIGAEAPTLAVHLRPTLNGAAEREHAREIAANLDGVTEAEFAVASGSRSVLLLRLRTP